MPRPAPDPKETKKRAVEVTAMVSELGGRNAAVRTLERAGFSISPDTLKRIARGDRHAQDDLLETMRALPRGLPKWLRARDDKRGHWLVHNHAPGFTARIVDGEITDIKWHDGKAPPARIHGDLIAAAQSYIQE